MCCEAVVGSVVWGWVDRRAGPGFLVPSAVPCGEIEQCATNYFVDDALITWLIIH